MEQTQYEEIEKHVPSIKEYADEVNEIVLFFKEKNLNIEKTSPMFWNHVITLLDRVDQGEQNEIELEDSEEMSVYTQQLTADFEKQINQLRTFNLTGFESYMLTIHFEQIIKENENE